MAPNMTLHQRQQKLRCLEDPPCRQNRTKGNVHKGGWGIGWKEESGQVNWVVILKQFQKISQPIWVGCCLQKNVDRRVTWPVLSLAKEKRAFGPSSQESLDQTLPTTEKPSFPRSPLCVFLGPQNSGTPSPQPPSDHQPNETALEDEGRCCAAPLWTLKPRSIFIPLWCNPQGSTV